MFKKACLMLCLSLSAALMLSCGSDNNANNEETAFSRPDFLTFVADAQIIPAYEQLEQSSDQLRSTIAALRTAAANDEGLAEPLSAAQNAWRNVANNWQHAHAFDFGPADGTTGTLGQDIATFPISTTKIATYIEAGDTSFRNFDRDTRGIYAIEYLLFGYTNHFEFTDQQWQYLIALSEHLHQQVQNVHQGWTGGYRESFIENDGTDAGSSVSLLVNAFALSYEAIKNFKFGLPLGLRPGQQQTEPQRVEAYYSDSGLELAFTHMQVLQGIWSGSALGSNNRQGLGFKHYLESVSGGPALVEQSEAAFEEIVTVFENVTTIESAKLSTLVENQDERLVNLHNSLQRNTRFFKSDLASLLGIYITYNSGDGD